MATRPPWRHGTSCSTRAWRPAAAARLTLRSASQVPPMSIHVMKSNLGLVWGAVWRAEVVHLTLLVLIPLALGLVQLLLSIVFLPFLLLSFGDTNREDPPSHLRSPGCWIAMAPCAAAEAPLIRLPTFGSNPDPSRSQQSGSSDSEPFAELPTALTLRHLWFFIWLLWFILFVFVRERNRRKAQ